MNLAELQVFMTVARERSFSRAATKLCRSQPAVSQAIQRLEQEIERQVFDRSLKNGSLTESGELLLTYGQRIMQLVDEARHALRTQQHAGRTQVHVGADECTMHRFLPLVTAFRRSHPGVRITVHRLDQGQVPQDVPHGALDMAVVMCRPRDLAWSARRIDTDRIVALMAPTHPRATASAMGRDAFAGKVPIVLEDMALASMLPSGSKAWGLDAALALPTLDAVKRGVELGLGIGLLPRSCAEAEIQSGRLVGVPIAGARPVPIYLLRPTRRSLSEAGEAFLLTVQDQRRLNSPT